MTTLLDRAATRGRVIARRAEESVLAGRLAARATRWLDGHSVFDAALGEGRPVTAVETLVSSAARAVLATGGRWRRAPTDPVGFPQQHSGAVISVVSIGDTRRVRRLRRAQAVVVDPVFCRLHADRVDELAAAGVPLVADRADHTGVACAQAPSVVSGAVRPGALGDVRVRELHSIRLRRRAMAQRRADRPGPPSVVMATRRPDNVYHALGMIERQSLQPLEVLVGLHGDRFDGPRPGSVPPGVQLYRYGDDSNLGEVLADLTERSRGAVVTKWDDDDWYGRHHLEDLVLAMSYSEAALVGKAAEFVFLEDLGVTIRRMSIGAESYSPSVAGGTLTVTREALDRVGGWPRSPRHVDLGLIERITRSGAAVYRTHGFEYVLRRRSEGHTWRVPSSYFVGQRAEQRSGLDLAFAGFDDA